MHLVVHSGTSEGLVSRTLRLAPLDAFGNIQEKCRFQYSLPFSLRGGLEVFNTCTGWRLPAMCLRWQKS